MAWFLNYTQYNAGKYVAVSIPASTLNASLPLRIEWELEFEARKNGTEFVIACGPAFNTASTLLFIRTGTDFEFRSPSNANWLVTTGVTLTDFNVFKIRSTFDGTTRLQTLSVNGAVIATRNPATAASDSIGALFGLNSSANRHGDFKYIKFTDFVTPANNRHYQATLSNGTGTVLPESVGGFNGSQVGTWPADNSEWVEYTVSGGPVTVTGGAAITFAANTVGGGKLIKFGGSNASFTFNTAGGGAVTRSSGSGIVFGVNGVGGGSILRRGGAGCAFSYNSAGGGVTRRRGGALLTFTLSMVGGGEVIAGADTITGGAAITFSTGITGGGTVLRRGGAALTSFSVTSIGGGNVKRRGGSAVPVSVNVVGSGNTKRIGGASVPFTVNTVGAGHAVRNGGDGIEFTVDTAGSGVVNRVGGSTIEFTVTMVGGGENLGQGYTPVITAPVITVSNIFASGDIAVDKTSISETVRVDKTSRSEVISVGKIKAVPYNLTVQKTFRGQTCIL